MKRDRCFELRGAARFLSALVVLFLAQQCLAECLHPPAPKRLSQTGLFREGTLEIARNHLPYTPQYPLWADGAIKQRWIRLPAPVDASDAGGWKFPVGTRFFKEFRFGGRRVETRLIERTKCGWRYSTYAWQKDQRDAVIAPAEGLRDAHQIRPGVTFSIPGVNDCHACHEGGSGSEILGFSALQLSHDVDPQALNKEPLRRGSVTLLSLMKRGLLKGAPPGWKEKPPRIHTGDHLMRSALGYLHGNCGNCHNARGELASLGLNLWFAPDTRISEVLSTVVRVPSQFQSPQAPGALRLLPGDPDRSTLFTRMKSRHPFTQMPPLATRMVDEAAVALIGRWIDEQTERKP